MRIRTKYFGEIACDADDILHFTQGLFGFEEEHSFLLLPFEGSEQTLLCLQSTTTAGLAFVVMNPFSLKPDYQPLLQSGELKALGAGRSEDLCYYVLCVVRNPVAASTVNLRCPVVINDETKTAIQVILDDERYNMRHLLSEFPVREADASC